MRLFYIAAGDSDVKVTDGPRRLSTTLERYGIDYIFNENTYVIGQDTVFDPADFPGLLDEGFFEDRKDLRARVAWTSDDDQWTLALWGKNLLDQKRLGSVRDISVLFGTPFTSMDLPRTWGIEIETRF